MPRAPDFWWREDASLLSNLLWPASIVWGAGSTWRMRRAPSLRPSVPVLCVGNFVVGGAGKTPTTMALARSARGKRFKPGILASGYGGSASDATLVEPARHTAAEVGDEPLLLATAAPTVVARKRPDGVRRLLSEGVDFILMDDGFQNPSVAKDISVAVVDGGAGIGNGRVMPAGPLRVPLAVQLRRADAVLVVGEGDRSNGLVRAAARAGRAVMRASLRPQAVRTWQKGKVLAFAGIGRPGKFFDTLSSINVDLAHTRAYPDHHVYTETDATQLLEAADREGLRLVTTEKDAARLRGGASAVGQLAERAEAFPVTLKFDNTIAVSELIDEAARRSATAQGHSD